MIRYDSEGTHCPFLGGSRKRAAADSEVRRGTDDNKMKEFSEERYGKKKSSSVIIVTLIDVHCLRRDRFLLSHLPALLEQRPLNNFKTLCELHLLLADFVQQL